tara:strand:- start:21710 stop:22120 length:411 start_codon:yes stop_codon:yes gene_type:complete
MGRVTRHSDLMRTQKLAIEGKLHAPDSFKKATLAELASVCNGCGSASAKFDFVPDKIYGTYIGNACHIHDWQYYTGLTIKHKEVADRTMLNNQLRLIEIDCVEKWYKPKFLMKRRAQFYYEMVCSFGGPAFWAGKE